MLTLKPVVCESRVVFLGMLPMINGGLCHIRTSCWWVGFDGGPAGWNLITFARQVHQGMAICWRVKLGDGSQEWCSRWMRFDGERDWVRFDRSHFVARTKVWSSVGASTSQRKEFYILDIFIYFKYLIYFTYLYTLNT